MQDKPWVQHYPAYMPAEITRPPFDSLVDLIQQNTRQFGSSSAFENMGKTISYAELDRLSDDFGAFLQNECKLKRGDRIAIQMPNLLQFPIAMVGAMKAGLIIVNTNPLYTAREMEHQFRDSGAVAIVILANFAQNLEKIISNTDIKTVIVTEIGDMLGGVKKLLVNFVVKKVKKMVPPYQLPGAISFSTALAGGRNHKVTVPPLKNEDTVFLQYTGGTTGLSKGAELTHGNLLANLTQCLPVLRATNKGDIVPGDVAVIPLPMYHIFALTASFAYLSIGMNVLLITNPKDLPAFIKELKKKPFHVMIGVNTLYNALLNHPLFKEVDLKPVKSCVAGGMALQEIVFKRWKEMTGCTIAEGYGLSETSPVLTFQMPGKERMGSIGVPIPSTEIAMKDDAGNTMPYGEAGELCARGPQVFKGYWQKDNSQVFHTGGWFKTGDIAVMEADGYIRIVDRKKDMILVSGFNVYPNEIENIVATHPKVLEVAAVGIKDDHSTEAVKLYVVKRDDSLTEDELREFCKENFTSYKRPKHIEFIKELPKTNVGKILRRALREEAAA
ncbi:MAG: AMP-binding protein [Cyclobacteriaceae bacterium]|jgi:long-chain acyl-CoA synthetase|nr:AMP-binding protein [Flammeovirgaceae bacterium]